MCKMSRTFTLLRTLGRGAHGAVHLAEVRDEDSFVQTLAIKRLLPQWSGDSDLATRLKDEARLLALLQHDHVVRVHGLTRLEGGLAILMEPIDGVDLAKLMERHGALHPRVCLEIVRAIADALNAAWNTTPPGRSPLRVVHRDIKPSNVMITARGGVKVMDFGVARATFETREGETRSQQFGTARYMAPERWLHGVADHRSDVFSLGVTLVELASGTPVARFRLSADGYAADRRAALAGVVWEPLRALADRMVAFEADHRPTAEEVVDACEELLSEAPGASLRQWAPDHVVPEVGEPVDPTIGATMVFEDTGSRSTTAIGPVVRPFPWVTVVAGALGVALVVGLATWSTLDVPAGQRAAALPGPVAAAPPAEPPAEALVVGPAITPAPAVVAPAVAPPSPAASPPPVARAEPRREPRPVVAEPAAVPRVSMRFFLADGVTAETAYGLIRRSPSVQELPQNTTLSIRVREGDEVRECTIQVGTVRIGKGATCQQSSS
jgi:tRNA A-37 threonylcarbamoyl transferase component Bud32